MGFFPPCFISRIKRCMALHFNTTMPDPMQLAIQHSSSPTTTSKVLPWPSMSPVLNPNKTHLERAGETCSRQSERPCNCAWVVSGTQAEVGDHSRASDSQHDPVPAWEILGSYWFWRTHLLLMCVSLSRKISSNWTFSWTRRVFKSWTLTRVSCKMKHDYSDF